MQIRRKDSFIIAAFMLVIALPGLAAQIALPDPSILKVAEKYRQAVLTGDAAALGKTYRSDAIEMAPGRPPLKGRPAIEQYYHDLFRGPIRINAFTLSYLEAVATGDMGYLTGTYEQKISGTQLGPVDDSGKFIVIVKRNGGNWAAAYVIYNSDRSPAANCAGSLPIPFPQRDVALLLIHSIAATGATLARIGTVSSLAISIALIWIGVRRYFARDERASATGTQVQNASNRSPSRTISPTCGRISSSNCGL